MAYKVILTKDAEEDLECSIKYLIEEKNNIEAAKSVLDDFDATVECLKQVAGSLQLCNNPRLKEMGYRRINFLTHKYFMLYRINDNNVIVDNIYHELQDYENKMI